MVLIRVSGRVIKYLYEVEGDKEKNYLPQCGVLIKLKSENGLRS